MHCRVNDGKKCLMSVLYNAHIESQALVMNKECNCVSMRFSVISFDFVSDFLEFLHYYLILNMKKTFI